MDYFRNIVVVAALAGAIAGLGMTIAQQISTVPMILKAEVYEEQSTPTAHDHGLPLHMA
jgi:predicted cobalt transporter CbtA